MKLQSVVNNNFGTNLPSGTIINNNGVAGNNIVTKPFYVYDKSGRAVQIGNLYYIGNLRVSHYFFQNYMDLLLTVSS